MPNNHKEGWEKEYDELWPNDFITERRATALEVQAGHPLRQGVTMKSFIRSLLHARDEEVREKVLGIISKLDISTAESRIAEKELIELFTK